MFNAAIGKFCFAVLSTTLFVFDVPAQTLEIRQYSGGLIRVEADAGLDLLIRPNDSVDVPGELNATQTLVLGDEFDRRFVRWTGEPLTSPPESNGKATIDGLLIESVLIGEKRAGIQIQTQGLKVLVASLDLLSDQGYIPMRQNENIHLLVLTVGDSKKLDTARTNLWLSGLEIQQIALNSTSDLPVQIMDKFYKSLQRNRTLPTAVLPMIEVPNKNLRFGDRQVVLLKQL